MARLRYNGLSTTLGGSLTNVATSVTFAAALTHSNGTNVPTIVAPDYIPLAILGATGHLSEIVYLTAYTAGATTGTITRGQEGTTAVVHSSGDVVAGAALVADSSIFSGFYGDGSDGNVTITTTVTLTRDMFYDTLTINSPGILQPNGFRVHCKTALVIGTSGILRNDGKDGAGSTAGAVAGAGTLGTGGAGGAGGTAGGTSAGTIGNSLGGASGAGGAGASGTGGVARTPSATAAVNGTARSLPTASLGLFLPTASPIAINGGNGGSGGGGDGTNAGGGGGGGGGVLVLNARSVTNSGTISTNGGAGGSPATGNCGGGGGGGGGVVIVNTAAAITGSAPTATGGAAGAKTGTGVAGSAGSAGLALVNVWI